MTTESHYTSDGRNREAIHIQKDILESVAVSAKLKTHIIGEKNLNSLMFDRHIQGLLDSNSVEYNDSEHTYFATNAGRKLLDQINEVLNMTKSGKEGKKA